MRAVFTAGAARGKNTHLHGRSSTVCNQEKAPNTASNGLRSCPPAHPKRMRHRPTSSPYMEMWIPKQPTSWSRSAATASCCKRCTALLGRTNRSTAWTLTPAGEALLQRARDILRSVEATALEIGDFTGDGHAHIRLAANHSSMVQFLQRRPRDDSSPPSARTRWTLVVRPAVGGRSARGGIQRLGPDVDHLFWPVVPQGLAVFPLSRR